MRPSQAHAYLTKNKKRLHVVKALTQPMTATQLSRRTGLSNDMCRRILGKLAQHMILSCLNSSARRSRAYWFTDLGVSSLNREPEFKERFLVDYSAIDWDLFGWLCFRHRAAVIKTLVEPMQPATIKRKARSRDPTLRMSANNVRDIIRLFEKRGIVRRVYVRKRAHACYDLTEPAKAHQRLLIQADCIV